MRLLLILIPTLLTGATWQDRLQFAESLERAGNYGGAVHEFEGLVADAPEADLPLALHDLATVYREIGRYPDAERTYARAISIWQTRQPACALQLASSLNNLGALHLVLGHLQRAEPLYRRAYELRAQTLGPTHPLVGSSLHSLAQLAHQRRQYSEAERLYGDAEAVFPTGSAALADVLHNHAILLRDLHREGEAQAMLERAATAYETTAPQHPKLAVILRNLAEIMMTNGNRTRAGELFERSLAICESSLPPDHPQTGTILQAYARYLSQTKRKKESEAAARRALSILGPMTYTVDVSSFTAR